MTTTVRKKTPAQARKAALESDYTPLYAVAGLTQVVASTLQATWHGTTERAGRRLADWQGKSEQQTKAAADELTHFVRTLPDQVLALPETTKTRVAELQKQAQGLVRDVNAVYGEFAGRGKLVVDETLSTARHLGGSAEKRAGDVLADAADRVDPVFEFAQEGVTQARRSVSGRTATETLTPRSARRAAATRAATRKAPATRAKAAAKKAPAKTATKTTAAKKTAVKKTAAKKATSTQA